MTGKRLIFIAILAAGAIALALLLWFTRTPEAPAPQAVSDIAPPAIDRVEVHLPEAIVQLERSTQGSARQDARWRLSAPVNARADAAPLQTLLTLAGAVPHQRYARDAIADDVTGLDDPAIVVRFNNGAPIAIGNEGPSPGSRYLATAHALLLVDARALARLPTHLRGWVAPTLLGRERDLVKLTLPRLTLSRSDTGGWQVAPKNADRGADYAQATIDAWRESRALGLEPVDAGRQRIARVTLRFADDSTRRIDVIAREPELILRDAERGIDYYFAANQVAPLLDMQHPDALGAARDRSLASSAIPLVDPDEPTPEDDQSANTGE
jgi:hypothetical protein